MNGTSAENWLYQGEKAKDKPSDLGYYIGYKIVESYYKNAPDKKQAVRDILKIKNFEEFLKASRYADKFKTSAKKAEMFDSRSSYFIEQADFRCDAANFYSVRRRAKRRAAGQR
jgi:hypothetical protein